jgi:hypothetical protein
MDRLNSHFLSPTSHSIQKCLGWQENIHYWGLSEKSLLTGNQPVLGAATEMFLLTGPPDGIGHCQKALVDNLGVRLNQYHPWSTSHITRG